MANPWANQDEFDDDEDESSGYLQESGKDYLIFLIDCRKRMLEQTSADEIPLENSLRAAIQQMKNSIISNEGTQVAIYFIGSEHHEPADGVAHFYQYQALQHPNAQCIKDLQELVDSPAVFKDKIGSMPSDAEIPLYDALGAANTAINTAKAKAGDWKRIWVFTNDDAPNADNKLARDQARTRAEDLAQADVDVTLFSLGRAGGAPFDVTKFWTTIVPIDAHDSRGSRGYVAEATAGTLEDLLDRVRRKAFRKRTSARIRLHIGPKLSLAVGVYNTILQARKPSAKYLDARSNVPLQTETNWICQDTAKMLNAHEISTYQKFGNEQVPFSRDLMKEVKSLTPVGVHLLGFKPRSALADHHNIRAPYFLYPAEDTVVGSTVAFRALHRRMIDMDKMGVVVFAPTAASAPRHGALIAVDEEVDESGIQVQPPGMYIIPMPYADDIRAPPCDGVAEPSAESVAAATRLVERVDLPDFSVFNFENPQLQHHYASVQALALEQDEVEWNAEEDDTLEPDDEGMAAFKDDLQAFKAATGCAEAAPAPARKRSAPSGGAAGRAKKQKDTGGGAALDWRGMVASGTLSKLTVPVLKEILSGLGKPVSGKKADLLERIEAAV